MQPPAAMMLGRFGPVDGFHRDHNVNILYYGQKFKNSQQLTIGGIIP